ncbi:MAG: hypothetical protein ABIP35_13160 [Ginsengibacter sp.]
MSFAKEIIERKNFKNFTAKNGIRIGIIFNEPFFKSKTYLMKKILVLTFAAASVITYLLVKNCACMIEDDGEMNASKSQHHLTDAFSKAKQYTAE